MENRPEAPSTVALLANADWVQRLARRLLADRHLAEDVAQEALTAALDQPPAFAADRGRLRRWLAGVTRHLAARAVMRERGRVSGEALAARPEEDASQRAAVDRLRMHRLLTDAVLSLDEPYRSTLVMRFFDDVTAVEIARRGGLPPATVRKRLSRGLALLRGKLDHEFGRDRGAWCAALAGLVEVGGDARVPRLLLEAVAMGTKKIAVFALAAIGLTTWIVNRPASTAGEGPKGESTAVVLDAEPDTAEEVHEVEPAGVPDPPADDRSAIAADAELAFAIEVVDGGGSPVPGAKLWSVVGETVVCDGRTDAAGLVRLDAVEDAGLVVAATEGRPPVVLELALLVGSHRVALAEGRTLAGRIHEDGERPDALLALELSSRVDPLGALGEGLREALREAGAPESVLTTSTDGEGDFAFHGLPEDWTGSLKLPRTHWFVPTEGAETVSNEPRFLLLPAPAEGLMLETIPLPVVRGRVVWADTREPVVLPDMMVWVAFDDGHSSPGMSFTGEEDGSFATGVYDGRTSASFHWRDPEQRPGMTEIHLTARAHGRGIARSLELDAADLAEPGNVGTIELERAALVHFLVRDLAGEPIQGARARIDWSSEPTDAGGRGVLGGLPPGGATVLVGAPGFRIVRVPVAEGTGTEEDPLVFVLEPGNRLELVIDDVDGGVPPGVRVEISGDAPLFDGSDDWGPTALHRELGGSGFEGASWTTSSGKVTYRPVDDGRIVLVGLEPSVPITVRVVDSMWNTLVEEELVGPARAEEKRHRVLVPGRPFSLGGRVVDESGEPVANASVKVVRRGGTATSRTAPDGTFRFENLYPLGLTVDVDVSLASYATFRWSDVVLAPETRLGDAVLGTGFDVHVSVVDELDRPVDVSRVYGGVPGGPEADDQKLGVGSFQLEDLSGSEIRIRVERGGRDYSITHDARQPEARIVLPVHGRVFLFGAPGLPEPEEGWYAVEVHPLDGSDLVLHLSLDDPTAEYDESEIMPLLPGRYRVRLAHSRYPDGGGAPIYTPVGPPAEIEVRPDETTRVTLDR